MSVYVIAIIPLVLMVMEIMSTFPIIPAKWLLMLTASQLEVLSKI